MRYTPHLVMFKAAFAVLASLIAPLAFGQELLRLDANDASTLTLAGSTVLGWRNALGAQTFAPVASAPTLVTNVANGQSAIRFSGGGGLLATDFGASGTELTIIVVAAPRVNAGGYQAFLSDSVNGADDWDTGFTMDLTSGPSTSFDRLNFEGVKDGGGTGFGGSNSRTSADPFGGFHILTLTYGASATLYVDGEQEGSYATLGLSTTVALDDLRVGGRYYSGTERGFFDGDIAEVRIYGGTLEAGTRRTTEVALGLKYGVPVPEPASFAALGLGICAFLRRRSRTS